MLYDWRDVLILMKMLLKLVSMSLLGTRKSTSVAQGAAENLAAAVASDLSLKDSAKSDSTGGGRLVDSSMQSDSITPKSAADSAKSDVASKPSVTRQESASRALDDKSEMISEKSTLDVADPPFDLISLLHSGQTLRYWLGGFCRF